MPGKKKFKYLPVFWGILFLFAVVFVQLLSVLHINDGMLVYTLDDPYIHMAVAENMKTGHYGVNSSEFSAPSSSIIWPFLLIPFADWEFFPFLLNLLSATATIIFLIKIFDKIFDIQCRALKSFFMSALVIIFILMANLIGLIFIGMEHSLQVLMVVLAVYGMLTEIQHNKVSVLLVIAIIFGPLVRYENMAISVAVLIYLLLRRHYKFAIISIFALIISLSTFSLFLSFLGLDLLPSSIVSKSTVVQSGGQIRTLIDRFLISLTFKKGLLLSLGSLVFLGKSLFCNNKDAKFLMSISAMLAILMHIFAGRYGWYHRYEIYIWSFTLLNMFYLFGDKIAMVLNTKNKRENFFKIIVLFLGFLGVTSHDYVKSIYEIPYASNNIYEQQYQMHRFVTKFYKKPVAVNDLGYVTYKNENYVLDLWGLGSSEALKNRLTREDSDWMHAMVAAKDVELIMIYETGFKAIPDSWLKIGTLNLGKPKITPAESFVTFYATNDNAYNLIMERLHDFIVTLPQGVEFRFDT